MSGPAAQTQQAPETPAPAADARVPTPPPLEANLRAAYRDGKGVFHADWPIARVDEAVGDKAGLLWVDIEETADEQAATRLHDWLSRTFNFHTLAIEDALKQSHVPKIDDWTDYLYIVFHVAHIDPEIAALELQELDIFLGRNYLITYHVGPMAVLDEDRLAIERDPRDRMRHGADHLLVRFLELAIDQSLAAIGELDEQVDAIQNEVIDKATRRSLRSIFRIKRAAIRLHKILSPQREVLNKLARDPYEVVQAKNRVYFRDLYDHVVRIHDISEGLRDLIAGTLETYLSVVSNRTNDIMKTLTIVTVMFMPMSFLVGFFGMNFFGDNIVLRTPLPRGLLFWGACAIMAISPCFIWIYARRHKWF